MKTETETDTNLEMDHKSIKTLGQLKQSEWQDRSVKNEIRENLIRKLQLNDPLFPGILGYEKTVIPQIINALLARHDMILLGLRGQGKSKILRLLVNFLDPYMPVVEGSEINDNPFRPYSKYARNLIDQHGGETPIEWIHRSERYGEKLATPDTAVADLVGDIDPIKAASKKLNLSDEEVINFGLIPHVNRGIFAINELPDLQPRIQVALLNIMQERDIQIRGFNIRFPLDVLIAFSANPEDYTNRGNIITPLKDRIDSQIITHYPRNTDIGRKITQQEAWSDRDQVEVSVPDIMNEIVEQITIEARNSEYIDQKSGVSTRLTITAMEQVISSAEQRAISNGEQQTVVRVTDLFNMVPALTGKLELVYEGEQEGAMNVAKHLIGKGIDSVFKQHFPDPQAKKKKKNEESENPYKKISGWFENGNSLVISDRMDTTNYRDTLNNVPELDAISNKFTSTETEDEKYAIMDLVIEALHQNSILGKDDSDGRNSYTDMLGSVLGNIDDIEDYDDFDDYDR